MLSEDGARRLEECARLLRRVLEELESATDPVVCVAEGKLSVAEEAIAQAMGLLV